MLRSFVWMLAAGALWFGGILCEPKHKDIYTVEQGHPMVRTVMPSPTAWTLALWALTAVAAARSAAAGVRAGTAQGCSACVVRQ